MNKKRKISKGSIEARPDTSAFPVQMVAGICSIALVLGYAGNLAILALNARLSAAGVSGAAIGLSTSIQAAGIVAGALVAMRLRERWGSARSIAFGLCLASAASAILAGCEGLLIISLFRFCFAVGSGIALSQSEYVLILRTLRSRCAVLIAAYATFFALGTLLASIVSANMDTLGNLPFFGGAACLLVSAWIPTLVNIRARTDAKTSDSNILRFSNLPLSALVPALAYGAFEGGLISLLNVYSFQLGYKLAAATLLVSVAIAGSLMLRIPFGMITAIAGTRLTLSMCWGGLLVLLASMHVCSNSFGALLLITWFLGGICDLFYIVGLASLAGKLSGRQLGESSSLFVATAGIGEILGPALGGIGLGFGGANGFLFAFWLFAFVGLAASCRTSCQRAISSRTTAAIQTQPSRVSPSLA